MTDPVPTSRFMDWCAGCWQWMSDKFASKPAMILGITIGAVLFATGLTFALVESDHATKTANHTSTQVTVVSRAFCNGSAPYTPQIERNCRRLLNQLLKNPTPEQATRLRQIVQGAK